MNISTLTDQVAADLEHKIAAGVYPVNEKIPPGRALTEQYGVSIIVVREAIERLKSKGLLASRQGSGVVVKTQRVDLGLQWTSPAVDEDFYALIELRIAIESAAARLAAERASKKDLAMIKAALTHLKKNLYGQQSIQADLGFHLAIAQAAHNQYFVELLEYMHGKLYAAIEQARQHSEQVSGYTEAAFEEHVGIYQAIAAHDAKQAASKAELHLRKVLARLS